MESTTPSIDRVPGTLADGDVWLVLD